MHRSQRIGRRAALLAALVAAGTTRAAAALPLLSEVFYDAVGTDNGLSFVEIFGAPGTDLAGFTLEGVNGGDGVVGPRLTLSGVIPADGFFVVADDAGDGTTAVAGADLLLNFDFQNGPDSIVLRREGAVIDAVGYGVFAPGEVFAGEGSPAPDGPAGTSLARRFADRDTDDNAADFEAVAAPTPGSGPLSGVPEPSAASLLGAGLAGLGRLGRRAARRR